MTGRIFISYRRADSQYAADRIYEKLAAQFGADSVFMDIDDIPLGVNFREYIDQQVSTSDIVLAVIGDHWLTAADADGNLRLHNPGDFVRLEIEAALCQGIKLIPVFIGDVDHLPASRLPESMQDLPMLNATRIRRGTDFLPDVDRLIRGIIRINEEQAAKREANKIALAALKQSAAEIKTQLSSFEAVMIQEMRTRTRLEDEVRRLEELVLDHLSDPAKQLRVDVRSYRQQIDNLRERLLELSIQIEARKQGRPLEGPAPAEEKFGPVPEREPEKQPAPRKAQKPKAKRTEKIDLSRIRRKIPIWAWGGLSVILLAAAFGPMILKGISAPLSEPTAEPSEQAPQAVSSGDQAKQVWMTADRDFIFWMDALADTTPDYLEDFSISHSDWFELELVPGSVLNDHITDGVLRIVDAPAGMTWYSIWGRDGGDFILQFDLIPHQFSANSKVSIDFRLGGGNGGNYLFEFQPDGTWRFLIGSVTGREELASGQAGPLDPDTAYQFRLYAYWEKMALMLDGGLLTYIEDDFSDSGAMSVTITSEDPIDVEVDNIKYWSLTDTIYLQPREEDQAQDFYIPVREYLAETAPTFGEDFETVQPYWEEMQIRYSETKVVPLSTQSLDGVLALNSSDGLEDGTFGLDFPDLNARAFALQYDISFSDPGQPSDPATASISMISGPEGNKNYFHTSCDFYQEGEEVVCGLYQTDDSGGYEEIFMRSLPLDKPMEESSTMLAIVSQGQVSFFLEGYLIGYTAGLDLSDQQIAITFGKPNPEDVFSVELDNIQFWNLDGVELTP